MFPLLLGLHLLVCLCLVSVILIQSGKGGGLAGGAFGGATQTVFGGRGATDFITRATVVLGVLFFLTSLTLALLTTRGTAGARSIVAEDAKRKSSASAPATPGGSAPGGAIQTGGLSGSTPPGSAPAKPAPATPAPAKPAPAGGTKH
jgi:preprotein translocase subunit SecG